MASAEDYCASESSNEKFFEENEYIVTPTDSSASGTSIEKFFLQDNLDSSSYHSKDFSISSSEGSVADVINGERVSIESVTEPSNFIIRIPGFDDQILSEQIRLARLHVEEKTRLRGAIQVQILEKRVNSQIHGLDYEYAKGEERSLWKLVKAKRMEINHLLSVINKAKNVLTVKDVDSQIINMEHRIQHETLLSEEEKQIVREMKQLKLLSEQLSPNLGSPDDIKQALEQREEAEKHLKFLRKELNILKDSVLKAEAAAVQAGKRFNDENKRLKELQLQLRAANGHFQVAYSQWQSLRKELWNKVENFVKLGNMNDEIHQEFVKFNEMGTVQRLGTMDDWSLGHINSLSNNPSPELKQRTSVLHVISYDKQTMEVTDESNQKVIDEGSPESVSGNGLVIVDGQDATDMFKQVPIKSEEMTELTSTAEETLRDDDKTKLKEKCRLEEVAKANEAREREKQHAKKIQMRKELKAQKEAAQKEKMREKRVRKKEKKKADAADANDSSSCGHSLSSEGTVETIKEMLSAEPKKMPKKPRVFTKRGKARSAPVPQALRNRNKKSRILSRSNLVELG